jgi:hypothetical protein
MPNRRRLPITAGQHDGPAYPSSASGTADETSPHALTAPVRTVMAAVSTGGRAGSSTGGAEPSQGVIGESCALSS